MEWDYAPRERSILTGRDLNDPRDDANIFFRDDDDFIGDVYKKAVYRGYTDASFTTRVTPDPGDLHKGILGPVVRAEVGDVIKVTFSNKASRAYSIHAHGVKVSESDSGDNYHPHQAVAPGQMKTYTWEVPARAGPGPNDPNCVPWIYYSGVDPVKDMYAGLVGVLVICRPGILTESGRRSDVDREFVLAMSVLNEMNSWYLDDNIATHAPNRRGTDFASDGDFEESNIMHAINGFLSGNTEHLDMEVNDTVAWYFASIGAEVDLHSFHLHGHTVLRPSLGLRTDVINLFPGQAEAVEMVADVTGTWLLHCHQLDHIFAGMQAVYTVGERGSVSGRENTTKGNNSTRPETDSSNSLIHNLLANRTSFPSAHRFPSGPSPLQVKLSLSLLDLIFAKKIRQELDILVKLTLQWAEPSMTWSPAHHHDDQTVTVPAPLLWTPDVTAVSMSQPVRQLFPADVIVSHTGTLTWSRVLRMTVLCDMRRGAGQEEGVTCELKFGSWNYASDQVVLQPDDDLVDLSGYFHGSRYQVTAANLTSSEENAGSKPVSYVTARFTFLDQSKKKK